MIDLGSVSFDGIITSTLTRLSKDTCFFVANESALLTPFMLILLFVAMLVILIIDRCSADADVWETLDSLSFSFSFRILFVASFC